MIVLQAIINIGVTTGVLPITGVPLPFVSFGGSSLLFAMMGMGIVLNISQYCGSPHAGFAGSGRSAGSRERGNMGMRRADHTGKRIDGTWVVWRISAFPRSPVPPFPSVGDLWC